MKKSLIISSLIFLMWFLSVPAWCGEGRYVIEEDTYVASNKSLSDVEQCKKAFDAKDYDSAYTVCLIAAEKGDAGGQYNIGYMFFNGVGVKQDYAMAASWYRKAAEQGNDVAQMGLGLLYDKGWGVKQDSAEAASWFQKSTETVYPDFYGSFSPAIIALKSLAEMGFSAAQYELATKYLDGHGVDKNRRSAEKWLFHSVSNNDKNEKSIELIEREFGWHCIPAGKSGCIDLINKPSIKHDKNLSWYWSRSTFTKIPKSLDKAETAYMLVSFNNYCVMNCNNRTLGNKSIGIFDENLDSVRNIIIKNDEIEFKPLEPDTYADRLFDYVCGTGNGPKKDANDKETSLGTGWPVQPGYIVTNQHVINGKNKITVISNTGKKFSAKLLLEDTVNDLALLQVNEPQKLPPALPLAKSSTKTGAKVFTIGYPHPDMMGAKPKLTEGIINAVTGYMDDPRTLQISVPVQGGNSGGPLLNMNGEVIGIVTSKLSAVKIFNWTGDLPQNVNYAVKAPYLTALISSVDEASTRIKSLPIKQGDLEALSLRIQNSILMIIAE
jgi:uncharacterized protein